MLMKTEKRVLGSASLQAIVAGVGAPAGCSGALEECGLNLTNRANGFGLQVVVPAARQGYISRGSSPN